MNVTGAEHLRITTRLLAAGCATVLPVNKVAHAFEVHHTQIASRRWLEAVNARNRHRGCMRRPGLDVPAAG